MVSAHQARVAIAGFPAERVSDVDWRLGPSTVHPGTHE